MVKVSKLEVFIYLGYFKKNLFVALDFYIFIAYIYV